jgi:hypothetical protein
MAYLTYLPGIPVNPVMKLARSILRPVHSRISVTSGLQPVVLSTGLDFYTYPQIPEVFHLFSAWPFVVG